MGPKLWRGLTQPLPVTVTHQTWLLQAWTTRELTRVSWLRFTCIIRVVGLERADEGWGVSKELLPQRSKGWLLHSADSGGCSKERSTLKTCPQVQEKLLLPSPWPAHGLPRPSHNCSAQLRLLCTAVNPCSSLWSNKAKGNLSKGQKLNLDVEKRSWKISSLWKRGLFCSCSAASWNLELLSVISAQSLNSPLVLLFSKSHCESQTFSKLPMSPFQNFDLVNTEQLEKPCLWVMVRVWAVLFAWYWTKWGMRSGPSFT